MTWLSIIIPVRKEPPAHLWFTLQSLAFEFEDVEILVVDNCPEMDDEIFKVCGQFGSPVRYLHAPATQSPYHPRNIGAAEAKGRWLLFLDAHVLLAPGSLARIREMANEDDYLEKSLPAPLPPTMVHFPVGFRNQKTWYTHYRLTLEKNFWGEWGPTLKTTVRTQIAASGIWAFLTRKKDWELIRGFNPKFSGYGGGEVYLQLKYWRMGGSVSMDPRVRGVHYSALRGYGASWLDRITNVGCAGRAVVGKDFLGCYGPKLLDYFQSKGVPRVTALEHLRLGATEGAEEGDWLDSAPLSFDQVLAKWRKDGVLTS